MTHYDLIVIGTGSGNSIVDERFDDQSVAIIEQGLFGGTCLNTGCIPTKMFVYAAEVARTARDGARYGVDSRVDGVRWRDIRDRVFGRIDPIESDGRAYRSERLPNVTVYPEHAEFTGRRELTTAGGEVLTADKFVIAAGSRAIVPQIDGLETGDIGRPELPIHTSDTVMRLNELPASMIVLGGGYIAAEMAHVFSALGTAVSIVARSAQLVRRQDADIAARFTECARAAWDVHAGAQATAVRTSADGVEVDCPSGDGRTTTLRADVLLVASGRRPSGDLLHADAAGLDMLADGRIAVDEFQRVLAGCVAQDDVFALGDVCNPYQLKHVANHEARVVQANLLNPRHLTAADHRFVPSAVFTHPQIASVGMTEQEARAADRRYTVATHDYGAVAYGWALEDTTGFVKLVADGDTGQLIGAHILGPEASMIIQPVIQAMSFGLDAKSMARGQYWIHPALPEVIENALLKLDLPG